MPTPPRPTAPPKVTRRSRPQAEHTPHPRLDVRKPKIVSLRGTNPTPLPMERLPPAPPPTPTVSVAPPKPVPTQDIPLARFGEAPPPSGVPKMVAILAAGLALVWLVPVLGGALVMAARAWEQPPEPAEPAEPVWEVSDDPGRDPMAWEEAQPPPPPVQVDRKPTTPAETVAEPEQPALGPLTLEIPSNVFVTSVHVRCPDSTLRAGVVNGRVLLPDLPTGERCWATFKGGTITSKLAVRGNQALKCRAAGAGTLSCS